MTHWMEELRGHRDWTIELLRMFLGAVLILKGFYFMRHMDELLGLIGLRETLWIAGLFAHYIVIAHMLGGAFVVMGLITRVSVAVQLPILGGAVAIIYRMEGAAGANFQLTAFVFLLLLMFLFYGGGRLSVDEYLARTWERQHAEVK